jgi:hypothetical protein
MALVLPVACSTTIETTWHFDGPVSVAVLQPETGGPFDASIGFVSNSRSGQITPLDLKAGRILSDSPASSFLRAPYIATGRARILGDVVVWAPDTQTVDLFVADFASNVLVEAPYIVGVDEWPLRQEPTASEPVFTDADGSGDSASVEDMQLRMGWTTTEQWTLTFEDGVWKAQGSRSGPQELTGVFGEPYHTDWREIELTIQGTASEGDTITFYTDTGVVEYDVGGAIQAMTLSPDQAVLAMSLFDPDTGAGSLSLFDMAERAILGVIPLPSDAQPYRMDWDDAGERLWVADASRSVAYEIVFDRVNPEASTVVELPMPGPLLDLAWVPLDDTERLVVAPVGGSRVEILDLPSGTFIDPNPLSTEVEGLDLHSPVTGLTSVPLPVPTWEISEWGARVEKNVVAVSLFGGELELVDVASGCLAPDQEGPHSVESSDFSGAFVDLGEVSDPTLWMDEATNTHMSVNPCAGVAQGDVWTLSYSEADQAWKVEGKLTGKQRNLAYENQHYVSDDGAVAFTIMTGLLPTTDGDSFTLTVDDGVLRINGDTNGDDAIESPFELPADPQSFWYEAGPTGGGWDAPLTRIYALWPIENSDQVVRARLDSGVPDAFWQ